MSRIGKLPIALPSGVTITIDPDYITVTGSKGTLKQFTMPGVTVAQEGDQIVVTRENDEAQNRAKHGLMRALVANMVTGVSKGFEKKLEVNGVGFRVALAGNQLKMNLGFSHDVVYPIPQGIKISTPRPTAIVVEGIDKQRVGQVALDIRSYRKPEPYKGKGVRYETETIRRKEGKKK